jgi:hypothetical protein
MDTIANQGTIIGSNSENVVKMSISRDLLSIVSSHARSSLRDLLGRRIEDAGVDMGQWMQVELSSN